MRQFQIAYHGAESFLGELQNFKRMYDVPGNCTMLFQIFSEYLEEPVVSAIGRAIGQVFPGIAYIGCSTGGNLVDCRFSSGISIVATLFECGSTKLEVYQYDAKALPLDEIAQARDEEACLGEGGGTVCHHARLSVYVLLRRVKGYPPRCTDFWRDCVQWRYHI